MKLFTAFTLVLLICISFWSCDSQDEQNGYIEDTVIELCGVWNIELAQGVQGTVEFTKEGRIMLITRNGSAKGDYSCGIDSNEIVITYLEDLDGNYLLSDEEEETGGITCLFKPLDRNSVYIFNLPFYRTEKILLIKQ